MSDNISTIKKKVKLAELHPKALGKFVAKQRGTYEDIATQELLSEKSNISLSMIQKIESGQRIPYYNILIDLADAIYSTPGELVMILAGMTEDEAELRLLNRLRQTIREYEVQKRGLTLIKPTPPLDQTMKEVFGEMVPGEEPPEDMGKQGHQSPPPDKPEPKAKDAPKQEVKPEQDNS